MLVVQADLALCPEDFYQRVINDHSVVVFALEWCEFCWSVKKLFDKCKIPYHIVNLDSAEYQSENYGKAVRNVMNEKTGCITIPQVFVDGEFIGGATETFDEINRGSLQARFDSVGVSYQLPENLDPYKFLPDWLQAR